MANFPTLLKPFSSTPLVAPSPKINEPTQGGKVTTRKNQTVGFEWTETYLIAPASGAHQGWMAQVQGVFYAGSMLTNKKQHLYSTLLGAGGNLRVSGSGQTGNSMIIYGAGNGVTVLKAGDLVQFNSGSSVTPVYSLTADCTSNAQGGATMSLVPDVLNEFKPAHSSSITLTPFVSFSCIMMGATFPPVNYQQSTTIPITIRFRETPL